MNCWDIWSIETSGHLPRMENSETFGLMDYEYETVITGNLKAIKEHMTVKLASCRSFCKTDT